MLSVFLTNKHVYIIVMPVCDGSGNFSDMSMLLYLHLSHMQTAELYTVARSQW